MGAEKTKQRRPKQRRPKQQFLGFRQWGGKRKGAGRRPMGRKAGVPHVRREGVSPRVPIHVTMRVAPGIWNLQGVAMRKLVLRALGEARQRLGVRVVQFSIQTNHLHLIVEAQSAYALSQGVKGLAGRLAKRINRAMRRTGRVFPDRFHSHVLKTPRQVRNAIRYVRDNSRRHAAQVGKRWRWSVDPFAAGPCPRTFLEELRRAVVPPRTWLLRTAWANESGGVSARSRKQEVQA